MTQSISSIEHLWNLAKEGKVVPVSDIPTLQLVSDATRTTMVQQGIIPAIKIGGRWFSDSDIVIAALQQEHDEKIKSLGQKKHHIRSPRLAAQGLNRRQQVESAKDLLDSLGVKI